jgi:ABC-2 type transport system ATP-binding protein
MLASTLIHDPDLIFLDEPTAGVDPVLRRKFWDRFEELASEGKTLLVTTQYVGEAAYCDYVAVLARGRILTIDTPEGLRRAAYGGEMIEVSFDSPPESGLVATMRDLPGVSSIDWVDSDRVRLVVDEAEPTLAALSTWAEERNVGLNRSETYLAPFDDVFVELVSRLEQPEEAGVGG